MWKIMTDSLVRYTIFLNDLLVLDLMLVHMKRQTYKQCERIILNREMGDDGLDLVVVSLKILTRV